MESLRRQNNTYKEAITLKSKREPIGLIESFNYLGKVQEFGAQWSLAEKSYFQALSLRNCGRYYFECAALTGLVRVKYAQQAYAVALTFLEEAEKLAQRYEYNDHLASLQLTQGHLALEKGSHTEAFAFYQKAMVYALRYNRFLLDELLSGCPQGTSLRPIIPYCLELGGDGRKTLIALRDWWALGSNDVGSTRLYTISPLLEGIQLLEAEKIARTREPGDGTAQKNVIEQIEGAVGM